MKSSKFVSFLTTLLFVLFSAGSAFAVSVINSNIKLTVGTETADVGQQVTINITAEPVGTTETNVAGAAFTLQYDSSLTVTVNSDFFDTFINQGFTETDGLDADGKVDGYSQPLVFNPVVTNNSPTLMKIAAARKDGVAISDPTVLFRLQVSGSTPGTHPIVLIPTKLNNAAAGYMSPTNIDLLVGAEAEGSAPEFPIRLFAADASSETFVENGSLTVPCDVQAAFSEDQRTVAVRETVTFTNSSTGVAVNDGTATWSWDFDNDGTEDRDETSPTFTFPTPGIYVVTLTATGTAGCETTAAQTITVQPQPQPQTPSCDVQAVFTADQTVGAGDTVTFTNTSTGDVVAAGTAAWSWDFNGDGAEDSSVMSPTFAYSIPNPYVVTLTATGTGGCQTTATQMITVLPPDVTVHTFIATAQNGGRIVPSGVTQVQKGGSQTFEIIPDENYSIQAVTVNGQPVAASSPLVIENVNQNYTIEVNFALSEPDLPSPMLLYPPNGETQVILMPVLEVEPSGEAEVGTQWEIALDESFLDQFVVWRETTDDNTLEVSKFILDDMETPYWWRARFVRADGAVSEWAGPYFFSTVENAEGDANENGIPDDQEVDPAGCFPDLETSGLLIKFVSAANGDGCWALEGMENVLGITFLEAFPSEAVVVQDNVEAPWGAIGYKLDVGNPGDEEDDLVNVLIRLSSPAPADSEWLAWQRGEGWQEYSDYLFSDDRTSVSVNLKDGGIGDADGIENGIILALQGFGVFTVDDDDDGGGDCFINSISGGSDRTFGLTMMLMAALCAAAVFFFRARGEK